jgi:DNA-binding GntR family transcriptional regulator
VANPVPKPTRTDFLYARLRADILGGRLAPGTRLKFPELSARFETSVGVVREALIRLAEQGLVRAEAHQGFAVTPLSFDDLRELTQARVDIECLVFGRAIVEGDIVWESHVVAAHHVLERTPLALPSDPRRLSDAWASAHAAFHQAILEGSSNGRLRLIAAGLRDEAELYRSWSLPLGTEPDRDLPSEHRGLLDAVLVRDAEAGAQMLRQHIEHTTRVLVESNAPSQATPKRARARRR